MAPEQLKIPITVNEADTSFGSCCLTKDFCAASECKKLSGRYGIHEKMLECLEMSIVSGPKRTVF